LAGFFLPLVAIGGLLGMNIDLPDFLKPMFWLVFFGGMLVGGALLWAVGRQTGKSADFDSEMDE
jgi:Mg2+ and Co2+ transporter CorA